MSRLDRALHHKNYSTEYGTPPAFFQELDREFKFNLDAAAVRWNAKCRNYYSRRENGLTKRWAPATVWLNPPYGRGISAWLQKAIEERDRGATVVALLPNNTDAAWLHDLVFAEANDIRWVRGRLRFVRPTGDVAPRPVSGSVVAIYWPSSDASPAAVGGAS